jgi:hypothetical protein
MSRYTYIFYMILVALVMILGQTHGTPKPMDLWEFIDWVGVKLN